MPSRPLELPALTTATQELSATLNKASLASSAPRSTESYIAVTASQCYLAVPVNKYKPVMNLLGRSLPDPLRGKASSQWSIKRLVQLPLVKVSPLSARELRHTDYSKTSKFQASEMG